MVGRGAPEFEEWARRIKNIGNALNMPGPSSWAKFKSCSCDAQIRWKDDLQETITLDFEKSALNAEVAQYWGCAQTRIHRVYERYTRRSKTCVPLSLTPNADLSIPLHASEIHRTTARP